jgi:hypothetical protein
MLIFAHMAIIEMIPFAQSTNRDDDEQPCHHIELAATAAVGAQILFYFYCWTNIVFVYN